MYRMFSRMVSDHTRAGRRTVLISAAALWACTMFAPAAFAYDTYNSGTISNVTFAGEDVLIMLSSGVPTNCTGTPYGWMRVPHDYKPMTAFVIGLWMRGDMSANTVTVYTSGLDSSGYCAITQIDPVN